MFANLFNSVSYPIRFIVLSKKTPCKSGRPWLSFAIERSAFRSKWCLKEGICGSQVRIHCDATPNQTLKRVFIITTVNG